jgi:hypothetical protein
MNGRFVQYGCGLCAPSTWRNFDVSPTLRLQRLPLIRNLLARSGRFPVWPSNVEYGDIIRGLPVGHGSSRAVYCSHTLEHLALMDFRVAIGNTFRYLEADGIFRFVVPDLRRLALDYIAADDPSAAGRFLQESSLGVERRARGWEGLLRAWWGNSAHLWMWDFESIRLELESIGFRNIRRAVYGDSKEARFADVEDEDRWRGCLGVECTK